jgi:hypothetical protein
MSSSMTPDSPVTSPRCGLRLRFGLAVAISLIWMRGSSRGLPGESGRDDGDAVFCECGKPAGLLPSGKYACEDGHVFRKPKRRENGKGKGWK